MILPFPFSILSHPHFLHCYPRRGDPSPQTQSSQYSQQPVPVFGCTQWAKPSTWINLTSAFRAPILVSHLGWAPDANRENLLLHRCFFLFSATAISDWYHFLQVHNWITTSFTLSWQSAIIHLYLPHSSLTKIPATHTWSSLSPFPTLVEGASLHLCSATLLRLLLYKLSPFPPKTFKLFLFADSLPSALKSLQVFPSLDSRSSQTVTLSLSFQLQKKL